MQELKRRAMFGDIDILTEYNEEQLGAELNHHGDNALHILAELRIKHILKFKSSYKLRNKKGRTATDVLFATLKVTREIFSEFYPWYKPYTDEETVQESLDKIQEMSNSEHFIATL